MYISVHAFLVYVVVCVHVSESLCITVHFTSISPHVFVHKTQCVHILCMLVDLESRIPFCARIYIYISFYIFVLCISLFVSMSVKASQSMRVAHTCMSIEKSVCMHHRVHTLYMHVFSETSMHASFMCTHIYLHASVVHFAVCVHVCES